MTQVPIDMITKKIARGIKASLSEGVRRRMMRRDAELSRKSKDGLWAIYERHHRVSHRDRFRGKEELITDIMIAEFGERRVTEFYG